MSKEPQLYDVGTVFKVTVLDEDGTAVDLSSATTKEIIFRDPTGAVTTQTASFFTTGTDGIITYTTQATTDIDVAGAWQLQAHVEYDTNDLRSNPVGFFVNKNLE